eukprot:1349227-Alexandrium_andersonii.AAC.1
MDEEPPAAPASPSDLAAAARAAAEGATWRQRPDAVGIWAATVVGSPWRPEAPPTPAAGLSLELAGAFRRAAVSPALAPEEIPEIASRV